MKKSITIFFIFILFSCTNIVPNFYQQGKINLKLENYDTALYYLKRVPLNNPNRDSAVILAKYCDSILKVQEKRRIFIQDSIRKTGIAKALQKRIFNTQNQLKSLFKFKDKKNEFRGNIPLLLQEIEFFKSIANLIDENSYFDNKKLKTLNHKLKRALIYRQIQEYPQLRYNYVYIINKKLWENDIKVTTDYNKHSTLIFTGGIFAANKNKKIFEDKIINIIKRFRFKKVEYKWYEGDEDYTTYNIPSLKDSDISYK